MNRRTFLTLGAAVAISPALPSVGMGPVAPMPPPTPYPAFAVGTPGEYDWRVFFARDEERAKAMWAHEYGEEGLVDIEVRREPHLANAAEEGDYDPSVADCLTMGWGHHCARHHDEVDSGDYTEIDGEAVCFDCITPAERAADDPDDFVDDFVNDRYGYDPEIIALLRPEDLLNPLVIEALADVAGMG